MKKYQLWLERKSYSQHLGNLMKIKIESLEKRSLDKNSLFSKSQERNKNNRNKLKTTAKTAVPTSFQKSDLSHNITEMSYIITSRELQNHKLRLMKSYQIINENKSLLRRITQAKPFTQTKKINQLPRTFNVKRQMERKNEENSERLKLKNFRHFQMFQRDKTNQEHRFMLRIRIDKIKRLAASSEQSQMWVQVCSQKQKTKSQLIASRQIIGHHFQMPIHRDLSEEFVLKLCYCKGLSLRVLGQYVISKPGSQSQVKKGEFYCINNKQNFIVATLSYKKIHKKFWDIRNLRI